MKISKTIEIPETEIQETFIKGGGPGGQNINKVATAVQLRFNLRESEAIPQYIKSRIYRSCRNRINKDGELIIEMRHLRSQDQNRKKAREVLEMIIRDARNKPKRRVKTKPSYHSRQKRLDRKKKHSYQKSLRRKIQLD